MRCLRVVTLFALVCGLAGVAHADYLRVTDPSDNPGPAVKALGSVPIGMNTTGTVTIKSCNNSRPMPDDNSCASGGGSSDLAAFNFGPGCSEFSYVPPPALPISITNNNSDVFTFRYTPTNRGLDTCVVTADANDADDTDVSFTLTGTGTGPELAMNPSPVAFGDTPLGMTVDRNITLTNPGENALTITSLQIMTGNAGDFSFTNQGCTGQGPCMLPALQTTSIMPNNGSMAVFGLRCNPGAAGMRSSSLVVTTNDPVMPMRSATLTCTGRVPELTVSAPSHDFGVQRVGTPSAPFTFTISNGAGAAPLTYTISGAGAPRFTITCPGGDPNCQNRTLNGGESTTFDVSFTPTGTAMVSQQITIDTNDPTPSDDPFVITVTGSGNESVVSAMTLDLGDVPIGSNATQDLTVSNTGGATLTIQGMAPAALEITGGANQFAIVLPAGAPACNGVQSCARSIGPVASMATTPIGIRCTPTMTGQQQATLTIRSDASNSPTTVTLRCFGTVPDVDVSQMMLAFNTQRVGVQSAAQTFTVSNSNAMHTAPLAYAVTVPAPANGYAITCTGAANCTGTLAAGESITVSVRFTPATAGAKMANVLVTTAGDPDEMATMVMLTGTGVEPVLAVDAPAPAPLAIGDVDIGASANGTITIRNSGSADLSIASVALVGGDAAQFSITMGATGAQTLSSTNGMNTRSWQVTCTPVAPVGNKSTTFRITHDAPMANTQTNITVTCTGRGAVFTASVAAIDFMQVQVGMPSAAQTFRFTNTGNKPGKVTMLTSTVNVFVPTTMANLMNDIAAGAFIDVSVVFTPADSSVVNGQVCGVNNGLTSPVCVNVTGDGQSVGIDVLPAVNFGNVRFDAAPSNSPAVTIRNTGESSLRIDSITSAGAPFTIVNGPTLPVTLGLNETRTFNVRLTPTPALGLVMRNISVGGVFTTGNTAAAASIIAQARIVSPAVSMSTDMIDFGMFDVDDPGTAVMMSVMIRNTSDAAVSGADLHIAAPALISGAPDFAIVNGAPATVAPGQTATLTVRFDPTTAGIKTGEVRLAIDTQTALTYTVNLRGVAIDQNVMCNPGSIMFPATVRRQSSAPIDATVTNLDFAAGAGTAAMLDYTAMITGANAAEFTLPQADAAGSIAGNAMKTLPITFTPSAAGAGHTATLVVSYNDAGPRSCMITLTGDGRLRQVTAAPQTIDFGTVAIGSTVLLSDVASMLQFTSNEPAGASAITVKQVTVTGSGAPAFAVLGGDTEQTLPMGGRAEYDVEFSPDEEGVFQADLEVFFDDDPEVQYMIHMTGRAVKIDLRGGGCDGGGGGAGALVGLAALGLLFKRRRSALAALATVALVATAAPARAQTSRGELDISTFTPAAETEPGAFTVLSPLIGKKGSFALRLAFHHDTSPLVADYDNGMGGITTAGLVTRRTSLDLGFAYALTQKLELGVGIPLHSQAGDPGCTTDCGSMEIRGLEGASGATLGDVAVRVKANLATSFGASLAVTAPTAKAGSFAGSDGPTAHLQALIGVAAGKKLDIMINGGLRARKSSEVLGVAQGTDVTYGAAASFRALDKVWAIGELYGSVGVVGAEGKVSPTQFALGVRYRAGQALMIGVGGGGGVFGQGVGSPELRGFASLSYAPGARPVESLRIVGRGDGDLPPPPPPDGEDDDKDGVANSADKCPGEAEDMDGFQDQDGCPEPDNDGDGVADAQDKCPTEPEDKDGTDDGDGCVDKDDDQDGIADVDDRCPKEPEDKDGFNDNDGCDDPDNDKDGVIDLLDQCAMEPETINGNNDDDGCPDQGDSLVMVMQDRIEALEPITFTGTTAKLTKGAANVLGQIGATLRADQSIKKIRVTVHVHPRGAGDQSLSDKRAEEIRKVLLQSGVEPERVDARGIGSQRPLVKPTAKGAEQINDRVEFIIFERKTDTAPKTPPKTPPTTPPAADTLK